MKLAIFDVDGTLVDSRAMITASLEAAFQQTGVTPPDRSRFLSIVGLSLIEAMRALVPDADPADHTRLAEAYKQNFWDIRASGKHTEDLFDGARDLLAKLRRREDVILGIATGKSRRGIAHLVEKHGFENWFATVQTADDHPSKPHPAMITAALAETGLEPAAAIMIGDTSYDMEMARAAGAGAIGVIWGNHERPLLEQAGAHLISNDFRELEQHLEQLWQERLT